MTSPTQDAVPDDAALDDLELSLGQEPDELSQSAMRAIAALRAALARATADNVCDVCVGTGKPISGRECMCGGSGKMSDAVRYLRAQVADQAREIARLTEDYEFTQARRCEALSALERAEQEREQLRAALRFYANREHLWEGKMPDEFDTVSGEPPNWWFGDECPEWGVEDGTIAKLALLGQTIDWEGEPPALLPEESDAARQAAGEKG